LSGFSSLALALEYGLGPVYLVYLFFFGLLLVASFIDLAMYILPDIFTLPGAVSALAASSLVLPVGWESALTGAFFGAGLFWLLQQGYRLLRGVEGMGSGDIKLMLLIGALVGWQGLPLVIFLASVSGLMVSIVYLARDRSRGMRTRIPFGPFLSLGTAAYILWGDRLWEAYLFLAGVGR
jgi:leader peptidase (prepilin peptidase)/N-methyltransferase